MEHSEGTERPERKGGFEDQVPGIKFLASLMKATIFTDLFVYHADLKFVHATRQERVDALSQIQPKFYKLCRNSDFVLRAVLVTGTAWIAASAAWGTVQRLFFA
jgi:hypothetical protein